MAGYAKAWTDVFDDKWYIGLSNYERGIWLQLFIYAKKKGDTGHIIERKLSIIAALMSCDVRGFRKSLAKMQSSGKVQLVETPSEVEIVILDYEYYQRVKKVGANINVAKVRQKCSKNAPISRAEQSRAEHTVGKNTDHKEAVVYFCEKYKNKFGIKYDFKKQDGAIIKRLLGTHDLPTLKLLINQLFITEDDFVAKQAGRTLGVLSACSNKLAQEVAKEQRLERGEKMGELEKELGRYATEEEITELFSDKPT